jgi:hypothetical protein
MAMTDGLGSFCDDFYVNLRLASQMPLPTGRDTLLHFFERIGKEYPGMTRFRRSESGEANLEEDRSANTYRWASVENKRIASGHVNPPSIAEALRLHKLMANMAPHYMGISPLEIDHLDVLFGFDLSFAGNHDEVVAEAMFGESPLSCLTSIEGAKPIDFQPSVTVALSDDCRLQARIDIVTRTNSYQVRTGDYSEDVISVYLILRRYWGDRPKDPMEKIIDSLASQAEDLAQRYVVPKVLRPLSQAISSRS